MAETDRSKTSMHRVTRDVTGPTGWVFSGAWDKLDQHGDAYARSFDRRIPPSLFVSERDRTRFGQPMPIVERCLEDAPFGPDKPAGDELDGDVDPAAEFSTDLASPEHHASPASDAAPVGLGPEEPDGSKPR